MLAVLTISGHRYPLGPVREWARWLDGLASALAGGFVLERDERQATVRDSASRRVIYTVTLEPWPTERETWPPETAARS